MSSLLNFMSPLVPSLSFSPKITLVRILYVDWIPSNFKSFIFKRKLLFFKENHKNDD